MFKKCCIFAVFVMILAGCSQGPIGDNPSTATNKIVNITFQENCTRQPLGTGSSIVLETFQVNKLRADTIFYIDGTISGFGSYSYAMNQGWKYGSAPEVIAQTVQADATGYCQNYSTKAIIKGYTTTGLQLMTFRYFAQNGATGNAPFSVYNPNSADEPRLAQTCSEYTIWEIAP
jgi:hypothetical protein